MGCVKQKRETFVSHLAPDFVLGLVSDSDNLDTVKEKMGKWITNGVRLAWLISPDEKRTYIYRPDQPVAMKDFTETLAGEDVLVGFETVLAAILEE